MAEYLQAPPRRKALGLLADALTSGQEALNTVNLPYVGGLGGLLFGQAPQYLQDVSYGMPAFRGGNVATGGLGTITPDTRMLDVATLPFVGAGAAKAGQVGAKTLGKEVARQVETGTGLLGSNVLDPRQYATVYHGSPATFDRFDINKLGSGEGAQAYGHGMYFAENPKVAEDYAKKLGIEKTSMSQLASDYLKQDVPPSAIRMLHDVATSSTPIEEAARKVQGGSIALRNESPDVLKNIVSDFRSQSAGKLYKVDIPDEYIPKMLDWDKPLSEQNSFIKNAFQYNEPSISNLKPKLTGASNPDWKYSVDGYPAAPTQKQAIENAMNSMKSSSWYTGNTGEQLYRDIAKKYATQNNPLAFKEASNELSKLGITGIKYLDQGSRAGQGTSNFVVFDPSNVKILEKGLLGK